MSADYEDGGLGGVALYGAQPELEAAVRETRATRPQQQVDGAARQEELVRVVVYVLASKVPGAANRGDQKNLLI